LYRLASQYLPGGVCASPHHGFSAAHTEADMDRALVGIEGALSDVRRAFLDL